MSGPKVVRIVTREEIIAVCEGHLARLDIAVEEWLRVGRRNETVSETEASATAARREQLHRLLAEERFTELQKAVSDEITYLQADQEARLARATAMAARARTGKRRTQETAATVLAALHRAGRSATPDLHRALEDAAAGRADGAAAISRGFALLGREEASGVSDHQRRLADALKDVDDRESFSEWLARQSQNTDDEALVRLDLQLAELATILDDVDTAAFESRLRRVASEQMPSRRGLLLDSLEVDLARAVAEARSRTALQGRLRMLAAELDCTGSAVARETARSIQARIDSPSDTLIAVEAEAISALEREREQVAAQARRAVVLQGLASLGYQVAEGLETAWVRDGRVVLKKSSQQGYGVEVAGRADAGRFQLRAVAIRDAVVPVDAAGDRDAETIWCADVTKLQAQLAETGTEFILERALPVGAVPLKAIAEVSGLNALAQEQRARVFKERLP